MDLHIILDIDQTLIDNMSINEYENNKDKVKESQKKYLQKLKDKNPEKLKEYYQKANQRKRKNTKLH